MISFFIVLEKVFSLHMGYTCDLCGDQRSMVYYQSNAMCLCLLYDRNLLSANIMSKHHSRTLCERCNSQPSFVKCVEERVSLCQNCDWMGMGLLPHLQHIRGSQLVITLAARQLQNNLPSGPLF